MGQTTQRGIKRTKLFGFGEAGDSFGVMMCPVRNLWTPYNSKCNCDDEFNNGLWQWLVNHECYKKLFWIIRR